MGITRSEVITCFWSSNRPQTPATPAQAVVDLRFRLRPKKVAAAKPKVAGPAPRAGAKGEEAAAVVGPPAVG